MFKNRVGEVITAAGLYHVYYRRGLYLTGTYFVLHDSVVEDVPSTPLHGGPDLYSDVTVVMSAGEPSVMKDRGSDPDLVEAVFLFIRTNSSVIEVHEV